MAVNRGTTLVVTDVLTLVDAQERRHEVCWAIALQCVVRGHVKRAELRGTTLGARILAECAAAGVVVVVERESMGIKWVRFDAPPR
jgi:hypothetical protein